MRRGLESLFHPVSIVRIPLIEVEHHDKELFVFFHEFFTGTVTNDPKNLSGAITRIDANHDKKVFSK